MVIFLIGISSCSEVKVRKKEAVLDNPAHHVLRGTDLIEEGRWNEAQREFRLALELSPQNSPALAGKALIEAHEATLHGKSGEDKKKLKESSLENLDKAITNADNPKDEVYAHISGIRVFYWLKSEDWLDDAEDHFEDAVDILEDNEELFRYKAEPHFFMARAYKEALEIEKASKEYTIVLELEMGYINEAREELELLQKILRAKPGSRQGKLIALIPAITRADLSALLIEELKLSRLYKNRLTKKKNLDFETPEKEFIPPDEKKYETPLASDIENHSLKVDIKEVLKLGVRGLEANPQHLFYPDQKITRAEYALMLEDILIQVTQNKKLSTKFIGEKSPWPDVRADAFYYNAARNLVSRNIMTVINKSTGEFGPLKYVHGADALLGIRILKDELESYVREPQI